MSRCFPFPPPGYERKHRPEDLDLLKEAKRKEKKHKKEKKDKDKERKKDKVKKEKDGSDEKHRDKKDRKGKDKSKKEKHRDKKETEDRGKDKDKSSISEESSVAGKLEEESGWKLHPEGRSTERSSSSNEGKGFGLFQGQNGGKLSQSSLPSLGNDETKFVQELDRRIREEKCRGSQLPERVAFEDKKDQEIAARAAVRNSAVLAEENGDNKNKRVDRKMDPQGLGNEFSGNTKVQNLMPIAKSKVEGIPRPADEQNGWRLEDKEKYKETCGVKQGDKKKDRDKESRGKGKDREKEKKKNDKVKLKTENKKGEQDKLNDDGKNDLGSFTGNKSAEDSNSNAFNEGNISKRKDMGTNGFLHENEIRPNKMQRPAPHQFTENGRKLEPFLAPSKPSHDKHAVPNSVQMDNKVWLMNGIIVTQKPSPSKPNPSAATVVSGKFAEASKTPHRDSSHSNKARTVTKMEDPITEAVRRPPHPDSKYLAEVLTVPKMADWSENDDDQEWLFSKKGPIKTKMDPVGLQEDLCVWSEAVNIESADVCALPYVIPY